MNWWKRFQLFDGDTSLHFGGGNKGPSKTEIKLQQKQEKEAAAKQEAYMAQMLKMSSMELPPPPSVPKPPPIPPTPAPATQDSRSTADAGDDARKQAARRSGMAQSILSAGDTGGYTPQGKKTLLG